MALHEKFPLLIPLAASLAFHTGGIAALDTIFGPSENSRNDRAQLIARHSPLRVRLLTASAVRPADQTSVNTLASGSSTEPLPPEYISLPGSYYLAPEFLDQKPKATIPVPLEYLDDTPLVAQGRIVFWLLINESGRVDQVVIETADAPRELVELAQQAFSSVTFKPGIRKNQPVKSRLLIEVTFEGANIPPLEPPTLMQP